MHRSWYSILDEKLLDFIFFDKYIRIFRLQINGKAQSGLLIYYQLIFLQYVNDTKDQGNSKKDLCKD